MPWVTPKTNWLEGENYNFTDWNRVINNMNEVHNIFVSLGYTLPSQSYNDTINAYGEIKYLSDANSVESRLLGIKNAIPAPFEWENTKTWTEFDTFFSQDANRWEKNVLYIYQLSDSIIKAYRRCGAIVAGGSELPQ